MTNSSTSETVTTEQEASDVINNIAGIKPGSPLAELRAQRPEAARFIQGSYHALLEPSDPAGVSLVERAQVALRVAALDSNAPLIDHYRQRLAKLGQSENAIEAVRNVEAGTDLSEREKIILGYVDLLTQSPHTAGKSDVERLLAGGLSTRDIVTIAQLIAYVAFQVRLLAGLQLLQKDNRPSAQLDRTNPGRDRTGFTLQQVDWRSYLDIVDPEQATEEQLAVMDESSPSGRTSEYYRLLVHDVDALRERSRLFKAVMYGPGGLRRPGRELASVAVSRVNGCVYCASVHSRLYAQLTKRPEVMQRIFDEGVNTDLEPQERAIVDYAVALTWDPSGASADLAELRQSGLSDLEILDLTHVIAMFAWANRLLQTLGEVVREGEPANA